MINLVDEVLEQARAEMEQGATELRVRAYVDNMTNLELLDLVDRALEAEKK